MQSEARMLNIGVDFDDVISQTNSILFKEVCRYFGKKVPFDYNDFTTNYAWEELLGVNTTELLKAFRTVTEKYSTHTRIPLIKDCASVLRVLKRSGHKLFVVSARDTWELPYSTVWLKSHGLLGLFERVIHRPTEARNWEEYKVAQVREFSLDVFIEDSPTIIEALIKHHIPTIVFDMPYNRKVKAAQMLYRVKQWSEVLPIVNTLSAKTPLLDEIIH